MAKGLLYIDGLPANVDIFITGKASRFIMRGEDFTPLDQDLGEINQLDVSFCVVAVGICWLVTKIERSDGTLIRFVCERVDDDPKVQQVMLAELILN